MTGFRAFSYNFVKTFPVLSKGFEIETEMSIHAVDKNMYVENVIVDYRDRPNGSESKLNTFSDGIKVLKTIGRLYRDYRPLGFYSFLAAILAIISTIFIIPVLITYGKTGLVPEFPTLIVCGFVYLAALLSFFSGMILASIQLRNRQEFEMSLMRCEESKRYLLNRGKD